MKIGRRNVGLPPRLVLAAGLLALWAILVVLQQRQPHGLADTGSVPSVTYRQGQTELILTRDPVRLAFGVQVHTRTLTGWRQGNGASVAIGNQPLPWAWHDLGHDGGVWYGTIEDSRIRSVSLVLPGGERISPQIAEQSGARFWYYVGNQTDLHLASLLAEDGEGRVLFSYPDYRLLGWERLTEPERKTVTHDRQQAEVTLADWADVPLKLQGRGPYRTVVKVTFHTNADALLGPIGLYLAPDSHDIAGYDIRE